MARALRNGAGFEALRAAFEIRPARVPSWSRTIMRTGCHRTGWPAVAWSSLPAVSTSPCSSAFATLLVGSRPPPKIHRTRMCFCSSKSRRGEGDGGGWSRRSRSGPASRDGDAAVGWQDAHSVLGVPLGSPLEAVRRAFVRLALELHPDQSSSSLSDPSLPTPTSPRAVAAADVALPVAAAASAPAAPIEEFLRVRAAYETIRSEHKTGGWRRAPPYDIRGEGSTESPANWSPDELRNWYRRETGEDYLTASLSMTEATRREVVHTYETMARGGLDRGGMWEMARLVAERDRERSRVLAEMHRSGNLPPKPLAASTDVGAPGEPDPSAPAARRRRRK